MTTLPAVSHMIHTHTHDKQDISYVRGGHRPYHVESCPTLGSIHTFTTSGKLPAQPGCGRVPERAAPARELPELHRRAEGAPSRFVFDILLACLKSRMPVDRRGRSPARPAGTAGGAPRTLAVSGDVEACASGWEETSVVCSWGHSVCAVCGGRLTEPRRDFRDVGAASRWVRPLLSSRSALMPVDRLRSIDRLARGSGSCVSGDGSGSGTDTGISGLQKARLNAFCSLGSG